MAPSQKIANTIMSLWFHLLHMCPKANHRNICVPKFISKGEVILLCISRIKESKNRDIMSLFVALNFCNLLLETSQMYSFQWLLTTLT